MTPGFLTKGLGGMRWELGRGEVWRKWAMFILWWIWNHPRNIGGQKLNRSGA